MSRVELQFQVVESGPSVETVAKKTEASLARVGKAAAQVTRDSAAMDTALRRVSGAELDRTMARVAGGTERAAVSLRDTKQAVGALAMAFGGVNPQIVYGAMELSKFRQELGAVGLAGKAMGVGLVAAGAAVAGLMYHAAETERIAAGFSALDRAVAGLDFGAVRSAITQTTVALDTLDRRTQGWVGKTQLGIESILRTVVGLPNAYEESGALLERARAGLTQMLPWQTAGEVATARGQAAELRLQGRQQWLGGLLQSGQLPEGTLGAHAEGMRGEIRAMAAAAVELLDVQRKLQFMEAGSRGTLDIESAAIQARFERGKGLVEAQLEQRLAALELTARQQQEQQAARREQERSFLAQADAQRGQSALAAERAQVSAYERGQANFNAWREKAMPHLSRSPEVDAAGRRALIAEEQRLQLAAIDETLAKQLWQIEQLKVAEADKARYIGSVEAGAEAARQAALAETLRKERELEQAIRQDLSAAATASAQTIAGRLGDAFSQAQASAEALAASLSVGGGGGGAPGSVLGALQKGGSGLGGWWASTETEMALSRISAIEARWGMTISDAQKRTYLDLQLRGGVGQTAMENEWNRAGRAGLEKQWSSQKVSDYGYWLGQGMLQDAGPIGTYDEGGVVPGPRGAARPAVVHAGEMVLTSEDQRGLLAQIRQGAAGGDLVVQLHLDGRAVAGAVRVPLQRAIRAGQVQVR